MITILRLIGLCIQAKISNLSWSCRLHLGICLAILMGRIHTYEDVCHTHECAMRAAHWKVNHTNQENKLVDMINEKWILQYENKQGR